MWKRLENWTGSKLVQKRTRRTHPIKDAHSLYIYLSHTHTHCSGLTIHVCRWQRQRGGKLLVPSSAIARSHLQIKKYIKHTDKAQSSVNTAAKMGQRCH